MLPIPIYLIFLSPRTSIFAITISMEPKQTKIYFYFVNYCLERFTFLYIDKDHLKKYKSNPVLKYNTTIFFDNAFHLIKQDNKKTCL